MFPPSSVPDTVKSPPSVIFMFLPSISTPLPVYVSVSRSIVLLFSFQLSSSCSDVISTVCVPLSQFASSPKASETARTGTSTLSDITCAGTSSVDVSVTALPFSSVSPLSTVSSAEFTVILTVFELFRAETVCVSSFHFTDAPSVSKIFRKGTITLPSII